LAATAAGAFTRAQELFDGKKPLTKAEKEELLSVLNKLSTEVNSNIPFVRDNFVEQTEKTVAEAKGNIEGFIQSRMASIANAAIAQNSNFLSAGGTEILPEPNSARQPRATMSEAIRKLKEEPRQPHTKSASGNEKDNREI
jgi:hypothetical protein